MKHMRVPEEHLAQAMDLNHKAMRYYAYHESTGQFASVGKYFMYGFGMIALMAGVPGPVVLLTVLGLFTIGITMVYLSKLLFRISLDYLDKVDALIITEDDET